jgi:hypothetical protein
MFLWGILHDKNIKQSLCIKIPERVNTFSVGSVSIGPSMAVVIEKESLKPWVIGVNANGELGLGDNNQRKTFCELGELKGKRIRQCAIGK